jgi:hypothetical protein
MPTKSSHYKEAENISENFHKQIDELIRDININDIKEVDELSIDDIDILLNSIKVNIDSTKTLMDQIENEILINNIYNEQEIYNLKIKTLLAYLGKNISAPSQNNEIKEQLKKVSIGQKNTIQNRDMNFITFEYESTHNLHDQRINKKNNKKISKKMLRRFQPDTNM